MFTNSIWVGSFGLVWFCDTVKEDWPQDKLTSSHLLTRFRVLRTSSVDAGRFWRHWLERVELGEAVTSLSSVALGNSPNLCGKDHQDMDEFLEWHHGGHFLAIFIPLFNFSRAGDWGLDWGGVEDYPTEADKCKCNMLGWGWFIKKPLLLFLNQHSC